MTSRLVGVWMYTGCQSKLDVCSSVYEYQLFLFVTDNVCLACYLFVVNCQLRLFTSLTQRLHTAQTWSCARSIHGFGWLGFNKMDSWSCLYDSFLAHAHWLRVVVSYLRCLENKDIRSDHSHDFIQQSNSF